MNSIVSAQPDLRFSLRQIYRMVHFVSGGLPVNPAVAKDALGVIEVISPGSAATQTLALLAAGKSVPSVELGTLSAHIASLEAGLDDAGDSPAPHQQG